MNRWMTVLSAVTTFALVGFGNRPFIPVKIAKPPAQHDHPTPNIQATCLSLLLAVRSLSISLILKFHLSQWYRVFATLLALAGSAESCGSSAMSERP